MKKKAFRVREVQRDTEAYVGVYYDTRTGYFSVHTDKYPLSAARWQHGKDVIKAISDNPEKFTWLKR